MNFYKTNNDDSSKNHKAMLDVFDLDVVNHNRVVGNITFKMNYHILNTKLEIGQRQNSTEESKE